MAHAIPYPAELLDKPEAELTDEDKVAIMWPSLMGYGYGKDRIPGLLEQINQFYKQTKLYAKIAVALITMFGLIAEHANLWDIARAVFGF